MEINFEKVKILMEIRIEVSPKILRIAKKFYKNL